MNGDQQDEQYKDVERLDVDEVDISLPTNAIEELSNFGNNTAHSVDGAMPMSAAAFGRADTIPCNKSSLWGYRVTLRLSSV